MEQMNIVVTSGFLGFLGGILGMIARHMITSKTRATLDPQPFEIRMSQDFVPRKEYREDIDKLFDLVREEKSDISDIRAGFSQQLGSIEGTLKMILVTLQKDGRL